LLERGAPTCDDQAAPEQRQPGSELRRRRTCRRVIPDEGLLLA
jgi:hypothetical protein